MAGVCGMKNSVLNIVVFGTCLSLLGGCGKEAPEKATGVNEDVAVDIRSDRGSMRITTPEATITYKADGDSMQMQSEHGSVVFGTAARIPEDFPGDVPLYPGLNIQAVTNFGEEGTYSVSGTVSGSVEDVKSHYQKEGPARGWRETMLTVQPKFMMLAYEKDDRTLQVMVGEDSGELTLSINTGRQ